MVGRLALFLAFAWAPHSAVGARSQRPGTLFIGNSMTFFNHGPDVYSALDPRRHLVDDIVGPGFTLTRHLEDARWPWTRMAALPYVARTRYQTLVLQEQSGRMFWYARDLEEREAALSSALTLARHAQRWGARVVLYAHPYRDGATDSLTYTVRQSELNQGYSALATSLRRYDIDVRIAPVGRAFALIAMQSVEPCTEGQEFDRLFRRDNHHPSLRGTYLAMALIYAMANDTDVRDVPDEPRLGHDVSARLRYFAHLALEEERRRVAQ